MGKTSGNKKKRQSENIIFVAMLIQTKNYKHGGKLNIIFSGVALDIIFWTIIYNLLLECNVNFFTLHFDRIV